MMNLHDRRRYFSELMRRNFSFGIRLGLQFVLISAIICQSLNAQVRTNRALNNIIPYPEHLKSLPGDFTLNKSTVLVSDQDRMFVPEVAFLKGMVQEYLGSAALKNASRPARNAIIIRYDAKLANPESYAIDINDKYITLSARDGAGMFYAIQTLRQLFPSVIESGKGTTLKVPRLQISDRPALGWRGMMLDVSRHFFSMQYLKKFTDMMAFYKLNKLHLHLTDDQGWRIEIKKYPRLTSEGAWRKFNNQDTACMEKAVSTGNTDFQLEKKHIQERDGTTFYGGFYTQQEMREFIAYAARLHIEVIPEIDMPGHMMAATALYPELTCDSLVGSATGTFSNPICPCKQEVLEFAKDIFSEIADLFPSKYIHIGGDEVNKKSWAGSPLVKAFMKEKGFSDMDQIQGYLNNYMLDFFTSKGKRLLGWDEIIEGGIDSSATVMYWRGWAPDLPRKAAENKNSVIMSPSGPLYFDAIPDALTLPAVYHYDPFDPALYRLDDSSKKHIAGVQANIWTEMIPSEKRLDYMAMPRLTALAEVGWSHTKMYQSYLRRLNAQYDRLDKLDISYRLPDLTNLVENYAVVGRTPFYIASPNPRFKIHYTLDGTLPQGCSPAMDKPVILNGKAVMKLALFTPGGRRGDVYTLNFNVSQYSKQKDISGLKTGLEASLYKGAFALTTAIKGVPDSVYTANEIMVSDKIRSPTFGIKFQGYIKVPETGIYTFYLTCNDGAVLSIGNQQIIDNDGLHPDRTKGGQAGLQKGLHPISLDFMEYGGGYALELKYSFGNGVPKPVPASWFRSTAK